MKIFFSAITAVIILLCQHSTVLAANAVDPCDSPKLNQFGLNMCTADIVNSLKAEKKQLIETIVKEISKKPDDPATTTIIESGVKLSKNVQEAEMRWDEKLLPETLAYIYQPDDASIDPLSLNRIMQHRLEQRIDWLKAFKQCDYENVQRWSKGICQPYLDFCKKYNIGNSKKSCIQNIFFN